MNTDAEDMRRLAFIIEYATVVEIHGGDRESGQRLNESGRVWVAAGLRLLAEKVDKGSEKPVDTPPAAG